jgi:type IV pilus assembly protein PilE
MKKILGFTLIELLIVLIILAIMSIFAYSSYQGVIIKMRRAEAQNELTKAQIVQSSYRITNPAYISDVDLIGFPSAHEFYTFSIVSASSNQYLIKAAANINSSQMDDEAMCQILFIDQNNNKTSDGSLDNAECW